MGQGDGSASGRSDVGSLGCSDEELQEEIVATWGEGTLVMGRYRLQEKLGAGGMGEVWRATDQVVAQEVAIKFLVGLVDLEARRRFSAEVRAMARLDHPHIAGVLDQGEHDRAPLFVMTLLNGLGLGRWVRIARWDQICVAFDQVLDALAYAHARGIVHRDLKPSNIIVGGTPDNPHAVVLDFGIAIDPWCDGLVTGEIVGSPGYMAPEQRRGETWRAREATDLFAVGILLYEALCGRSPFSKDVRKDDFSSPAFLVPRPRFPLRPREGFELAAATFEGLLRRLLALPIVERPLLAADVREELARGVAAIQRAQRARDEPTPWDRDHEPPETDELDRTEMLSPWHPVHLAPRAPTTRLQPGCYGLYGLRQAPVHGRVEELKRLWRVARQAFASGRPRVVCLEGIAGIGKTHLAQHLCELANEQGLARYVEVSYLPQAPATSGVVASLDQLLRARQAPSLESARTRVEAWLADEDAASDSLRDALLDLLRPSGPGHFDASLRRLLFLKVLRVMCRRRAVIALINDIHWCRDGTALPMLVDLVGQHALPVLALVTVRVEEQDRRFAEDYAELFQLDHVERLSLGPLPEEALRSVLRSYMALEEGLESLLVERSEGLPILATQLLDELVRDGAIEVGTLGGRLRPGRTLAALPQGAASLWHGRIDRVRTTDEAGEYWVDALQGLALSRVALTRPVLEAAARVSGEDIDDAVAAWEREGLIIQEPDESIRFLHSEIGLEVAQQASPDAAARWNVVWAAALQRIEGTERGRYGLERGLHLAAAGEREGALAAFLAGAEQAHHWGDTHRCLAAAKEAEALAREVRDRIRLAWAMRWRGAAELAAGQIDDATRTLDRARELFEAERVLVGLGWTLDALGWARIYRAAYEPAVELTTYAAEAFRRAGDEGGLATALGTLGYGLARVGRYAEAGTVLREAEDVARRSGDARALVGALQGQAEAARYQGMLDHAESWYQAALATATSGYRAAVPSIRDGLGLVALARGDVPRARDHLAGALELADMEGQDRLGVLFSADLAATALLAGDRAVAEEALERAEAGAARLDRVDEHMQWSLWHSLTAEVAAREPDLVARAGELAARLWDRLGRPADAGRVLRRLEDLRVGRSADP